MAWLCLQIRKRSILEMWRPMLRKSMMGEDLLEVSKQKMEKSTGSLQSGTILTVHLEVVSDTTLMTLGMILELCNITLFPDTCLDFFFAYLWAWGKFQEEGMLSI